MPDWTKSMQQSYEYYVVEPTTLADVKRLDTVKSASFSRDAESATLGSATIDATQLFGEAYVRGYLKTVQNGVTEKHPLGTVLVQTPSSTFNGMYTDVSMDAYTPLIELKEKRPPLGYTIRKGSKIMDEAYRIIRENCRIPVVPVGPVHKTETVIDENGDVRTEVKTDENGKPIDESPTLERNFVANTDDTWLTFIIDLIKIAEYELALDETGRIKFSPIQEFESLQPVWTFDDSNSSILYPEITMNHDLYGIPNVVKVVYSYGGDCKESIAVNDDPNSPTSTISRGREIPYLDTKPSLSGYVTQAQVDAYAEKLLKEFSTVEYSISYTHAYCPVRLGDCVRLNYKKAGIENIKAKVVSQNIKCDLGCSVSEKAVFTTKLWR